MLAPSDTWVESATEQPVDGPPPEDGTELDPGVQSTEGEGRTTFLQALMRAFSVPHT